MKLIFLGRLEIMGQVLRSEDFVHEIIFADFDSQQQGRLLRLTAADGSLLYEGVVLSPEAALRQNYDFIVVYTELSLQQVYTGILARFEVPFERVMDYRYFHQHCVDGVVYQESDVLVLIELLRGLSVKSVLDGQLFLTEGPHFTCPAALDDLELYGIADAEKSNQLIYQNMYQKIFSSLEKAACWHFDALLLIRQLPFDEYCRWIRDTMILSRYLIFYVYTSSPAYEKLQQRDFSSVGDSRWIALKYGNWFVLDKGSAGQKKTATYVVMHKPSALPQLDSMYIPIQAGRALHTSLGCADDAAGDNISRLNPYLNECTALYWIWKHADADCLGLVHYRRYFAEPDTPRAILKNTSAAALLAKYDILMVKEWIMGGSVELQLQMDLGMDAFQQVLTAFRQVMQKKQPEYLASMEYVLSGRGFFRCNMFITHRRHLDAYCRWLFSFLLDIVEKLRPQLDAGAIPMRSVGFFAERMLTVWLMRQKLRIKELPILELIDK